MSPTLHSTTLRSSACLAAMLMTGCDRLESPPQPVAPVSSGHVASVDLDRIEPLVFGQPDQHFLGLTELSNNFAGAYWEGDTLVVRSKSGAFPTGLTPGTNLPVSVRKASHSFDELARWHRIVHEALGSSAQWIDIDERANLIAAAVGSKIVARQALRAAGVPDDVFVLRDTEPIRLTQDLTDPFRPVPGGVGSFCTVGFNVEHWQWGKTFVIPSHCTGTMLVEDGTVVRQPDGGGAIGTEVYDDPGFTGSPCGGGDVCRYSDAAVIEYSGGIDYELGKIARTTGIGSTTISTSVPRFNIGNEELNIFGGYELLLMGKVSGWQEGEVTQTCASVGNIPDVPSNLRLLCQFKLSTPVVKGDSGSPVLTVEPTNGRELAGMIWAAVGSSSSWFSPIDGIRQELNPNSSQTCEGLLTTATGGCGGGSGGNGGGGSCDNDPTAIECQ